MSRDILGIIGRREPVIGRPVVVEQNENINKQKGMHYIGKYIEGVLLEQPEKVGHITRLTILENTKKLGVMVMLSTGEEIAYEYEDVYLI